MRLDTLTNSIGEWLRGTGPDSDIVMSSRVRLARNLAQFPFVSRATEQDRAETERVLRERIVAVPVGRELDYIDVGHLEEIDRRPAEGSATRDVDVDAKHVAVELARAARR